MQTSSLRRNDWIWRSEGGNPLPICRVPIAGSFSLLQAPFYASPSSSSSSSSSSSVDFLMADHNQREEARPRKPRNRKDLKMEEFPTFTKWLTPFCNSVAQEDARSKSKRVRANRPTHRAPVIVLDSSEEGREVAGDASILSKEGMSVVGEGDSISARRGCCRWRRAKPTTGPECSPECHVSLRRSRVVANTPEEVVAAGDALDKEERGCLCCKWAGQGCFPTFQICGRRDVPMGAPNLPEEGNCRHHSNSARRRCLPTFHICGRRKKAVVLDVQEEGVATDVPDLRKKEVTTSGSDLVEEGEATVAPDMRKEGSGCCCARWECLPAFRRRKVAAGKEGMTVDVPSVPEVDDGVVNNMHVGVSEGGFRSAQRVGWFQAFPIFAGRKRVVGDPNKEERMASSSSNLLKDDETATVGDSHLHKEGSGCVPRRKVASEVPIPIGEEKVVADVSELREERVATADVVHSISAQGGCCCPFQICSRGWLPKFLMCSGRTAVDASKDLEGEKMAPHGVQSLRREEEEVVAVISDQQEEKGVATVVPDLHKENIIVAAGDIPSKEERVSVGDGPDLHEEEVSTGGIPDLREEISVVSSVSTLGEEKEEKEEKGGCRCFRFARKGDDRRRRRSRNSRSREDSWSFQICGRGWLPTFNICRGNKKVSVVVTDLHEEEGLVVNDVSNVPNEVVVVAGASGVVAVAGRSNSTRGCGCWQSKSQRRWLPTLQIFRRKTVAAGEDGGGRGSKSKRRRGWSRRRGRKQREEKEREREREIQIS